MISYAFSRVELLDELVTTFFTFCVKVVGVKSSTFAFFFQRISKRICIKLTVNEENVNRMRAMFTLFMSLVNLPHIFVDQVHFDIGV